MGNGRVRGSDVGIRGWEWKELGLWVGGVYGYGSGGCKVTGLLLRRCGVGGCRGMGMKYVRVWGQYT